MRGMYTDSEMCAKSIHVEDRKTLTPDRVLPLDVFSVHLLQGLRQRKEAEQGKTSPKNKREEKHFENNRHKSVLHHAVTVCCQ